MRITVAAIGRLGRSPETEAIAAYAKRLDSLARTVRLGPLNILELEDKSRRGPAAEAVLLRGAVDAERRVVMDERGRALGSVAFAERLRDWRDAGAASTAFLIGGADGHDPNLRADADLVLSLGPMTWPHALARLMLVEQLYRAATILAGHPYHRE